MVFGCLGFGGCQPHLLFWMIYSPPFCFEVFIRRGWSVWVSWAFAVFFVFSHFKNDGVFETFLILNYAFTELVSNLNHNLNNLEILNLAKSEINFIIFNQISIYNLSMWKEIIIIKIISNNINNWINYREIIYY